VPLYALGEPDPLGGIASFRPADALPLLKSSSRDGGWRKGKYGETTANFFAFLTTDANNDCAPVHTKAMQVILDNSNEREHWLFAAWADASGLQRPLSAGKLVKRAASAK